MVPSGHRRRRRAEQEADSVMIETVARPAAPAAGDRAPDAVLGRADGSPVRLADLWMTAPRALVLVFVRHLG
jgi:hypothetical protein